MCSADDRRDKRTDRDWPQQAGVLTVLVVDDDEMIRDVARQMLDALGHEVVCAANGLDGLKYYKAHKDEVDIVILDFKMPVMDGRECFRELKVFDPEVKVILSSADVPDDFAAELRGTRSADLLPKPYTVSELSGAIARILSTHNGLRR